MNEPIFGDGIRFSRPKPGAPAWIKGQVGVEVDKFIQFLTLHKDDKGWVNLDLKESKEGNKLYFQLNTWKPVAKPVEDGGPTLADKLNKQYDDLDAPTGDIPF